MGVPLGGKPLQDVSPGDHICYIHSGEPEWISALVMFVRRGLELNQKVVYVGNDVDPSAPEKCAVWANLSSADVDTGQYLKKGQLLCMNGSDLHCPAGVGFDPQKSLASLAALSSQAVQNGYSALRIWVEMSWVSAGDIDAERFLQLECMGNKIVSELPLVWCCCYLQSAFQPSLLVRALEAHPIVAHPRAGCSALANTYFIPCCELSDKESVCRELDERLRNIAEQNQTIARLRHCTEELEEALKRSEDARAMQSAFTAVASHELRTPLNAIIGYTDLCLDPKERPFLEENLLQVKENSLRLLERVNDVLDFSRLEAGQLRTVSSPFSLAGLLDKVHSSAAGLLAHKQSGSAIQLRRSLDPSLAERVCGDEARVLQIMLNLVSNAIKFTDQGELEYGARLLGPGSGQTPPKLQLFARDTGRGMSEKFCRRIFQPYAQEKTGHGGTGLGLCISHRLAIALGGELTFQTKLGQGTTFHLNLPYKPAPATPGSPIRREASRPISPAFGGSASPKFTLASASSAPYPGGDSSSVSFAPSPPQSPSSSALASVPPNPPSPGPSSAPCLPSASEPLPLVSASRSPTVCAPPVKVLVADDDLPCRRLMERILCRAGYAVETAADGAQAVEKVRANPDFSLVLMDMHMPVMNGVEATKAIRELVCERCGQRRGGGGVERFSGQGREKEEAEEEKVMMQGKQEVGALSYFESQHLLADAIETRIAEPQSLPQPFPPQHAPHNTRPVETPSLFSAPLRSLCGWFDKEEGPRSWNGEGRPLQSQGSEQPHERHALIIEVTIETPRGGKGEGHARQRVHPQAQAALAPGPHAFSRSSLNTSSSSSSTSPAAPAASSSPPSCICKQPAVVFLSAQAMPGEMERVGADGYLVKPIGRQQLLEAVQRFAPLGLQ